jgi:hypothetical protein
MGLKIFEKLDTTLEYFQHGPNYTCKQTICPTFCTSGFIVTNILSAKDKRKGLVNHFIE